MSDISTKQDVTKEIASKYLLGGATAYELYNAAWSEVAASKEAEIEKLREDVKMLSREIGDVLSLHRRIDELEYDINRPWWKKLLRMK